MTSIEDAAPTPYKKPPIVEAVLALHFFEPVPVKAIETFAAKRKSKFPRSEDLIEMEFETNLKDSYKNRSRKIGQKLYSVDGSRIIIFQGNQFALIHLAPYTDWDCLFAETRDHWETLTKIVKHKKIRHFSTRYVNRIDIPVSGNDGDAVTLEKFFKIGVLVPATAKSYRLENFSTRMTLVSPDGAYRFLIQFSDVPSPLIDHMSFTIDIDLITSGEHPLKEDEAWEFLRSLRQAKNDIFEACITDETRKLFE
jgi:uncharacterized protein (TIGR04255 family)